MNLSQLEKILSEHIYPDLKKGRKDWDLPHTKAVVFYMKKLLKYYPEINKLVMVAAAYAHDWGYVGQFKGNASDSLTNILNKKESHMVIGAERIRKLLSTETSLSKKEIDKISHLVLVHDKLELLKTQEEIILMEADTLGALDVDLIKPLFSTEDNAKFLEKSRNQRLPLFRTKWAKIKFDELINMRKNFYLKSK